jgi:hypothetical protein
MKKLERNSETDIPAKKPKFAPVQLSDSESSVELIESSIKGEVDSLKRRYASGNDYQDWKLSKALKSSSSDTNLLNNRVKKSFSVDSMGSITINTEMAKLDYLHANACPAPLPSELIKVPSFHSQDLVLDDEEDVEAILQQFL